MDGKFLEKKEGCVATAEQSHFTVKCEISLVKKLKEVIFKVGLSRKDTLQELRKIGQYLIKLHAEGKDTSSFGKIKR